MALNLKTFFTRSMSAVVFVIVLLGSLFFSYSTFSLFFLVVALIGVKEFMRIANKLGAQPYQPAVYAISALMYLSFVNWQQIINADVWNLVGAFQPLSCIVLPPFIFLCLALFDTSRQPLLNALYSIAAIGYAVVPMCLLHQLVFSSAMPPQVQMAYQPWVLFGIILLIWSNDTFAYLGGSFFGKRKLIERISPGKTIEGTAIGIAITFLLSALLPAFIHQTPPIDWMVLGLLVPVLATLGDLIESMLKRSAGIKDSGNILPGHGGVLDRFDSLILVSPVLAVLFHYSQL